MAGMITDQKITDKFSLYCGDCCEGVRGLPSDSIHYSVFSPPFSSLYSYSDSEMDMGNCKSDDQFFEHFDYLISELLRATMPGRLCSVHSMQLPSTMQSNGEIAIRDFPGNIVRAFCGGEAAEIHAAMRRLEKRQREAAIAKDTARLERLTRCLIDIREELSDVPASTGGWKYHSRVVIWKDPLIAATRTKAIGLAHKQIVKDSTRCRQGIADYLDTFMKPGDNPEPVSHKKDSGLREFIGSKEDFTEKERRGMGIASEDPRKNTHSHVIWRRYASPVWSDIRQTRVVGQEKGTVSFRSGREDDDTKHICPLQLDVIDRCIELWTNEGDVVLSPFAGVGSEGYSACSMGRRFVGFELKKSYFDVGCRNAAAGVEKWRSGRLFD